MSTPISRSSAKRSVETPSGRISYTEQGAGPVALFVHGVLLNGHLWRHQLADLSDIRRCIAVDLLAHGDTEIAAGPGRVRDRQREDARGIPRRAEHRRRWTSSATTAAAASRRSSPRSHPERVRSLTLTDCDAHDAESDQMSLTLTCAPWLGLRRAWNHSILGYQ